MRPEKGGRACLLSDHLQNSEERPALNSLQLNCAAVMSHISPAEASNTVTNSENTFPFSPLNCISHRRKRSVEDDTAFRSSCFCPAGLMDVSSFKLSRAGVDEATPSPVSFPTSQQFDTDAKASFSAVARHPSVSGGRRSDQALLQNVKDVESSTETAAVHEDVSDSDLLLRGRTVSVSAAEQEEEVVVCCYCFRK